MQSKKDFNSLSSWRNIAAYPVVKGSLLGSSVMYLMTPFLNYTTHYLKGETLNWRYAMTGSLEYASSAIPCYAISFTVYHFFKRKEETASILYDSVSSLLSGVAGGFVSNPFENVAQNKQLATQLTSTQAIKQMVNYHGWTAPFQGSACSMTREGAWGLVVLSGIRNLSNQLVAKGTQKPQADFIATVLLAGIYGAFSSPLNQLRFRKQLDLINATPKKSYLEHVQDIWKQQPEASTRQRVGFFFKGCLPRSLTTTLAAGLMYKGGECYDHLVMPRK